MIRLKRNQAFFKFISIIVFIMILLKIGLIFLWPFLVAGLLALLIEPIILFFISKKIVRKKAIFLSYSIFAFILILSIYYLTRYAYDQIISFINDIPKIITMINEGIPYFKNNNINQNQIKIGIESLIIAYKNKIFSTVLSTANATLYFTIIALAAVFISMDMDRITSVARKLLPQDLLMVVEKILVRLMTLFNVELRLTLISSIQTTLGLYVLGVNRPLTLGIICGILDILPIVGTALIFIPMIIYGIILRRIFIAIGLILLYILIQVSRKIMEIKYLGNNLKMHPFMTLFALYTGVLIYDGWGFVLGPILIIIIKELYKAYFERSINFKL